MLSQKIRTRIESVFMTACLRNDTQQVAMSDWIYDEPSLRDFISYVLVNAPEGFPVEDFLPDEEQMTLELAFEELRQGIQYSRALKSDSTKRATASDLLERSLRAYRKSEWEQGAALLCDFEKCLKHARPNKK
jgi:hypothetical protein